MIQIQYIGRGWEINKILDWSKLKPVADDILKCI